MGQSEQRRFYRTHAEDGWAVVSSEDGIGRFRIRNISMEGALLDGDPPGSFTKGLRVRLQLPGLDPIRDIDCEVVRREPGRSGFVVVFGYLTDDEEEQVEEFIVERTMRQLNPHVIIANSRPREARALARSLQMLGYRPVVSKSPEDVHTLIDGLGARPFAVVLGTHVFGHKPSEVGRDLADRYPGLRRILVARPDWRLEQEARGRFDATVPKPWTAEDLESALCLTCG